ncbi:MAG: triacylglycerol lipase, partial [Deltaproteobacteria bacterium]|nr:triacylglycerol lipase [Deltaproteobacteria bacterium]
SKLLRLGALLLVGIVPACVAAEDSEGPTKEELAANADAGKSDGIDWCKVRDFYGDGDCDRFCENHDQDCPLLGAEPANRRVRYPVIIHHGFAGGHSGVFAYTGVAEAMQGQATVVQTQVPPFDGVVVRSAELQRVIDETLRRTGAAKVNIIAHSLGGLDARHLISRGGYGDRVASLTTISTPHQGTRAADLGLGLVPGFASSVVNAVAGVFGAHISDGSTSVNVLAALRDLAEANAAERNRLTPDDSRVFYQSWAGVSTLLGLGRDYADAFTACDGKMMVHPGTMDRARGLFAPIIPVISRIGRDPHDGLVTVASSKWGQFNGCIPADHSDEVGQVTSGSPNPRTSFDHVRFYKQVADDLSARGF